MTRQAEEVRGLRFCKICDSTRLKFSFHESDGHRFHENWQCGVCGVSQTLGNMSPVSPDYVGLTVGDLSEAHRFLQTHAKARAFAQWRTLMATHNKVAGNLLDIGCGVGGFLDYAGASGFVTYGFDASAAQVELARARHPMVRTATSLATYDSALDAPLPPPDVVTMWDVFEHIREPRVLLADIRARLAPDGLLFVSVPGGGLNRAKVALTRLRGRPPGLIPWEHVFYHVPGSLKRVMEENSFVVVAAGGVVPYTRAPGLADTIRRSIQRGLASSRYALQLFAIARPAA